MTKQPTPRFPRHRHEWRDLGPGQAGDWRYRCAVCHRKSRNPFYQPPQFRHVALAQVATDRATQPAAGAGYIGYTWRAIERRVQRRRAR